MPATTTEQTTTEGGATAKGTRHAAKAAPRGTEKPQRFRAELGAAEGSAATSFDIPFDVQKVFGTRARA